VPVEMLQFLLQLLLKQKILAVDHDFLAICVYHLQRFLECSSYVLLLSHEIIQVQHLLDCSNKIIRIGYNTIVHIAYCIHMYTKSRKCMCRICGYYAFFCCFWETQYFRLLATCWLLVPRKWHQVESSGDGFNLS